ncbi:K+/H+ antiporter [Alishewanella longhuensis]
MISRGDKVIPPRGSTILQPEDYLFIVLKHDYKDFVEQAFADKGFAGSRPAGPLRMKGATMLSDIDWCYGYGAKLNQGREDVSLEGLCVQMLGNNLAEQAEFKYADRHFKIVEMVGDRVVTLSIQPAEPV